MNPGLWSRSPLPDLLDAFLKVRRVPVTVFDDLHALPESQRRLEKAIANIPRERSILERLAAANPVLIL